MTDTPDIATDPLAEQIYSVLLACEAKLVELQAKTGLSSQKEAELDVVRELLRSIRQSWQERLH